MNKSTEKTTSKNSSLYQLYYAQTCNEFARPFATTLRLGNTVPFKEKSQPWCAIGKSVFDLTGPGFESLTSRTKTESKLPHRPVLKLLGRRIPLSRFRGPPSRFERWMIRQKRLNSSPNFGEKPLQFPAKTFFFGLHLILAKKNTSVSFFFGLRLTLAKKHFKFRRRSFFLVFIQFRRRNYVIFTKVLSHAKYVWSRLQKRPPMQNCTI